MLRSEFNFDLPDHLIAQYPPAERGAGRLLTLDARDGGYTDRRFADLPDLLRAGDLLVFNDTRVIPARLLGRKASGGKVEVLVERITGAHSALTHVRASKSPKAGTWLELEGALRAEVVGRQGELFELRFDDPRPPLELLLAHGRVPLPPYIERAAGETDAERYQTVYASAPGAVAAPTAGLHFDEAMLERLRAMGVQSARVTLHVGAGTFQPVRAEHIEDHLMHSEYAEVPEQTAAAVREARAQGRRVIAVGTTSVRSLESAAAHSQVGTLAAFAGETDIFIYPGYAFQVVDAMITNFHLPESTLLMLVSAFAGREQVLAAYRHAVASAYRFFSYGDAMFIYRR